MREIVRLIVFAVIIFAVSAASVLLSDPGFAATVNERLGLVAQNTHTQPEPAQAQNTENQQESVQQAEPEASAPAAPLEAATTTPARLQTGDAVVRIARPQPGIWLGLEGFPSATTLRFPLPADMNIVEGQVQLDLHTQLIEQGDGLLRVMINGTERDAIVLDRGESSLQLTYDLLASDFAAEEVLVTLDADGTTNYGQICPSNVTNLGAAVAVLDTSGLVLALDAPPSSVATRVALLPLPLGIMALEAPLLEAWAPEWLSRQGVPAQSDPGGEAEAMLLVDQAEDPLTMSQNGQITLGGIEGVTDVARIRGGTLPQTYGADWPLPISALTTDLQAHTFRGSSRWTLSYKQADLPDGKAPSLLHLALRTSRLSGENDWSLRVLLNGNIVHATNVPGNTDTIDLDIPIGGTVQQLSNQLHIVLVDNSPNQGICRAGREAVAQLLPESRLEAATGPEGAAQAVVANFAATDGVLLVDVPSAPQGVVRRASALLGDVLPLDVPLYLTGTHETEIRVITADNIGSLESAAGYGTGNVYVVSPGQGGDAGAAEVRPLEEWLAGPTPEPGSLIVSW